MRIRGTYEVQQVDQTLEEQQLRNIALVEILRQVGEQAMLAFGSSVRLEVPSPKYPYGRYVIDLDINLLQGGQIDSSGGVQTISE